MIIPNFNPPLHRLKMAEELLLDNSFIWGYRAPAYSQENKNLLEMLLQEFDLNLEDAFFTERSFLEVIGKGKISIELGIPAILKTERKEFQEKLRQKCSVAQNQIEDFINLLEKEIHTKLKVGLPKAYIAQFANENINTYPFIDEFKLIDEKIIEYANNLNQNDTPYDRFLKILVEDSVIRFILDTVNLREINPQHNNEALKFIDTTLRLLLLKYGNAEIFKSNLILVMAGLKKHAEVEIDRTKAGDSPLIRVFDDRADGELGYYSLVGKHKNGKQVPVTVISSESRKVIEKRLIYNFKGMGEIAMYNPIGLMCGRIINVNFTSSTYEEILTGKLIHEKFRDVN
jgi:hypothetical protein